MRFYADENFPLPVAAELRKLGHDVLTAFEDGRANRSIEDDRVLARSHKLERILLTINRTDFRSLHNAGLAHSGTIICTFDPDFVGQAGRIDKAVTDVQATGSHLVRVNRPGSG